MDYYDNYYAIQNLATQYRTKELENRTGWFTWIQHAVASIHHNIWKTKKADLYFTCANKEKSKEDYQKFTEWINSA